ncbi:zinc finger protein [Seiridium cupressi]
MDKPRVLISLRIPCSTRDAAIEKEANEYAQQFSAEAVHLWTIKKNHDSILTIISAQILSLAYMGNGKDHDVLVYQVESVRMGARLGLLGVNEDTAALKLAELSDKKLNAYSFAAWGVFN